jgi:hypothetical protein
VSRDARRFVAHVRADLQGRRWMRLHACWIALLTLAAAWGTSHALMVLGLGRLSVRYGLAFVVAYGVMLALLYLWAHWLLSRDEGSLDGPQIDGGGSGNAGTGCEGRAAGMESGGGGDFGGAGGGGSFDRPDAAGDVLAESGAKVGETALEVAAAADEGIVIVVPLMLLLFVAGALASLLGLAVFGLFGVEVLLGVAVELALASVGGALAYKAQREGWLGFAWRRTRAAAAGLLCGLVLLGATIDHWVPEARSAPHAVRLLRQ